MGFVAIAAASPGARCMVPGSARAAVPRSRQAAAHIPAIPGFSFTPRSKSHESATTRRMADDPKQIAKRRPPNSGALLTVVWWPSLPDCAGVEETRAFAATPKLRTALADSSTREYPAAWGSPRPVDCTCRLLQERVHVSWTQWRAVAKASAACEAQRDWPPRHRDTEIF